VVLDGLLEAPYQFDYLADSKLIMVLTNYGMCYLLKRPALSVDILSKGKSYYSVAQLNSTTFATDDFALWRVTNEGNREIPIKNTIESRYDRLDNRLLDKWSSGVLAIETENLFEVDTNLNISKRTYPEFLNNSKPIAIEKSKNENYWVITNEETLFKVDKNFKVLKQLSLPLTVNNDYNFIDELPNNWTYISGGDNKNLYKVHSETLQLDSISFFKDKPVRAIHSLSQDTLLIATYGFGIFGLIDDQIIPLPLDKNEAVLYSSSLVPDDLGTLWISTNNGLLRINLEETKCYLNGNCERVFYNRYSKNDGLLTNEFNGGRGPAFVKLNSQKLIFPSMNGIVVINPEKSIPNDKSKNLRFDQIYIDEKQVDFIEQLTLPADFKRLKVNVSTTFWGKKENLLIEYKIEDFDDRWYRLNDKKLIEVNNIGSGDYILKIRTHKGLVDSGLGGYYAVSALPFTILPHFYETRLFIVTSLLFVFLILYFIYRYRLKFLQNLNIELQKEIDIQTAEIIKQNKVLAANVATKSIFMNIIAHDITSPLNFLELTVKTLKNKIIDQIYDKEAKEQLMNVSLIVSNLNQMTKNYLRWLKVINPSSNNNQAKKFNVHKVVEEVLLILQPMLKSNGINSINNIPVDTSFYFIPDALKVILHNLIDNIMKYGKATELELSYFSTEKSSGILLKDDSQSKLNIDSVNQFFALNTDEGDFSLGVGGLGFIIIREMLELSNGNLSVSSNISKGFTYKISISTKE
jgi:signal transduction histidine kinase